MAKATSQYTCSNCSFSSPKWHGRCPQCGEWETMVETLLTPRATSTFAGGSGGGMSALSRGRRPALVKPTPLAEVNSNDHARVQVPIGEFNRVVGGGLVPGSLVLIGGDPGIGKSTLISQVAALLASREGGALYVSAEESAQQLKLRVDRLKLPTAGLSVLSETNLDLVLDAAEEQPPGLLIIDSIQTVYLEDISSAAGSVSQVRGCTERLMRWAKPAQVPVLIVGHVTKEGAIAGPRVLEHMVDAVLYLEGDRFGQYRILRAVKNRFGSTNEVGIFEMRDSGMREVTNPSEAFLQERAEQYLRLDRRRDPGRDAPVAGRGPGADVRHAEPDAAPRRERCRCDALANALGGPRQAGRPAARRAGSLRQYRRRVEGGRARGRSRGRRRDRLLLPRSSRSSRIR